MDGCWGGCQRILRRFNGCQCCLCCLGWSLSTKLLPSSGRRVHGEGDDSNASLSRSDLVAVHFQRVIVNLLCALVCCGMLNSLARHHIRVTAAGVSRHGLKTHPYVCPVARLGGIETDLRSVVQRASMTLHRDGGVRRSGGHHGLQGSRTALQGRKIVKIRLLSGGCQRIPRRFKGCQCCCLLWSVLSLRLQ